MRGRTVPEWANMVGPFGGITAATLLHAVQVQPDCHGQPVALTVNFAAPIADGEFDIFQKITAADVKRVAQQYFTPENRTVITIMPSATNTGSGR